MFGKVIIMNKSTREDTVFDYRIPEEYEKETLLGRRVLVPLGPKNIRKEGYIIDTSEITEVPEEKVKDIISFSDDFPLFDKKMLELAQWLSREHSIGLVGALKLIIPAGISMKEKTYVRLKGDYSGLSADKKKICGEISRKGGLCQLSQLKDSEPVIKELEKDGIVEVFRALQEPVLKRNSLFCALTEKGEESGEEILSASKRLKTQLELFLLIKERKELPLREISSRSSLKGLKDKGLVRTFEKEVMRDAVLYEKPEDVPEPELTSEQKTALDRILNEYEKDSKKPVLLFGVTGSGKTEVYIRLIERILSDGKQVILLVPEISLTPLMTRRIFSRFGDRVTITHSRMTAAERFDQWKKARSGKVSVIIGPRSAVFAPFDNLGGIIVDEEHEDAFHSENLPAYDAKEIARFRCKQNNAVYLAGSATPSVETFFEAEQGNFLLCELTERVGGRPLPKMEIIDMRKELHEGNKSMFGEALRSELKNCLDEGRQAMLFINRRGYASFVSCRNCGYVVKCGRCSVSMTLHANENVLLCHYCGSTMAIPKICPKCGSKYIKSFGTGTERVEEEIKKLFPEAKTLRMDADTTKGKYGHEKILSAFAQKKADILIGTQMIAKGHDFPMVSIVGIIAADLSLNTGDFRDGERTYRIITQAAGRAGRGEFPGKVFIQTYSPENYAVRIAAEGSYREFYRNEIMIRKTFCYPPFNNFFTIMLWGPDEKKIIKSIHEFYDIIKYYNTKNEFQVLGPAPAYRSKIKDMHRWRVTLTGPDPERLKSFVYFVIRRFEEKGYKDVYIYPAFNPLSVI